MEGIDVIFQDVKLLNYADMFEEKGNNSLDHLLAIGPQDLLEPIGTQAIG